MYKRILYILLLSSFISSCGIAYLVKVDSFGGNDIANKTYTLMPLMPEFSGLEYNEYSKYVHSALKEKGYINLDNKDKSNIVIFMSYGISDPSTYETTTSIPQWGQTGVSSSYTSGTFSSYGGYTGSGRYSGTTSYSPTYGVTGYTPITSSYTNYTRYLKLSAVDSGLWRNNKENIELWKTSVTSTGSSGDLRQVMPYMIIAVKPHIGTNTGQQLKIEIDGDNKNVKALREGKTVEELEPEKKIGFNLEKLFDIF
jgi:hypothetical protein